VNFDEWRRRRDGNPSAPPAHPKIVADILNTHQGLCYIRVSDVALDEQDGFWLRRSAKFELIPGFGQKSENWIPVSGFSYGGKVHTDSDVAWEKLQSIPKPDPAEWARVYRIGE
jgi:hypothetical protein